MRKALIISILFSITTILMANEIKLGNPVNVNYLQKFYGEEETSQIDGNYSNIYANYEERYILYDINLYRMAPHILLNTDVNPDPEVKKCINWGYCFQPTKPMYWNLNLSRAARYHSNDMIVNKCFSHNDCDGGDIWDRIKMFYTSSRMGENIAAGSTYEEVTRNFINEKAAELGTVGHRENIFSSSFNEVGLGYLKGGNYRLYTTQDFGASAIPHIIPAAIHYPQLPSKGSSVLFKAIYHGDNDEPQLWLILNDQVFPMSRGLSNKDWKTSDYIGDEALNSMNWNSIEFKLSSVITSDCNKYSFLALVDGKRYRYPDKGSLVAGKNCSLYDDKDVTVNEAGFIEPECDESSCTEENRSICSVQNYQVTCSCDEGFSLNAGVCNRDSSGGYASDDGCSYGGEGNSFFVLLTSFFLLFWRKRNFT